MNFLSEKSGNFTVFYQLNQRQPSRYSGMNQSLPPYFIHFDYFLQRRNVLLYNGKEKTSPQNFPYSTNSWLWSQKNLFYSTKKDCSSVWKRV